MTTLLVLHNSVQAPASTTRDMTAAYVARYVAANPHTRVIERDLVAEPVPHLSPEVARLHRVAANAVADDQAALGETLIAELEAADVVVIGAPMHNFTISSNLKAWLDHVVRAGRTFAYVDNAPRGLLTGKKVVVLTASGGIYSQGPTAAYDFLTPYLRAVLGFIGLTDVTFVRAEGLALPHLAQGAREAAVEETVRLAA